MGDQIIAGESAREAGVRRTALVRKPHTWGATMSPWIDLVSSSAGNLAKLSISQTMWRTLPIYPIPSPSRAETHYYYSVRK